MVKVGDKVIAKCKGKTKPAFRPENGVECVITKVTKHAVLVQYDEEKQAWLRFSEIKRVSQPKYTSGDKVTIVDFYSSRINYTGRSGVIQGYALDSLYEHSKVYAVRLISGATAPDSLGVYFIPETALIPLYKDDILIGFIDEYGGESDV